jgi:hypothetical protein
VPRGPVNGGCAKPTSLKNRQASIVGHVDDLIAAAGDLFNPQVAEIALICLQRRSCPPGRLPERGRPRPERPAPPPGGCTRLSAVQLYRTVRTSKRCRSAARARIGPTSCDASIQRLPKVTRAGSTDRAIIRTVMETQSPSIGSSALNARATSKIVSIAATTELILT